MNALQKRIAMLLGFPKPADGNVPGYPATIIDHPYQLDRLAWDFPLAMRRVSTVRACVLRVAHDIASLPVIFERQKGADWTPLARVPNNIVDVWQRMNDQQTCFELVRDLHAHLKASGNAYLVAETFGTNRVQELWTCPPQYTQIIPGERRRPKAYIFNRGGVRESIDPQFVIHLKGYTPDFEPVGGSDLESAELAYTANYDISRLIQLFARNGGIPAGYWTAPSVNGMSMPIPGPEQEALKKRLDTLFSGIKNAFRHKIMDTLKFEKFGLTPAEMALIDLAKYTDGQVCRALGVPPWLIGIKESSGRLGNSDGASRTDVRIYWQNTILPDVSMRDAALTEKLCPMFEVGIRARTDVSGILELNEPLLQNATAAVSLVGRPIFTVNEMRKMVGQPPSQDPEADVLYEKPEPAPFGGAAEPAIAEDPAETKPAPVKEAKGLRMIVGDADREDRRKKASANLARYERRVARFHLDLLRRQRDALCAKLEAQGLRGLKARRTVDPDEVIQPNETDQASLEEMLTQLVTDRGEEALADLALTLNVNLHNLRATRWIKDNAQRTLALTTETTRAEVRAVLAESMSSGLSLSETVAKLREMPAFDSARATLISRTETGGAYNFAAMNAYAESGVVDKVAWLTADDDAVREWHADADGQEVGIGSAFDVMGESLEYPGDPAGSPENVCNCRCTIEPVVNDGARARLLFKDWMTRCLPGIAKPEANGVAR